MHAFSVLSTDRPKVIEMAQTKDGPVPVQTTGPIPWSRAILYAEKRGFDRSTQFWFANVMLHLDHKYRDRKDEESQKDRQRQERHARMRARQAAAPKR